MRLRLAALALVVALLAASLPPGAVAAASPAGGGGWVRSCTIHIVAVSSAGGGVLGNLTVTIRYPGSGRVYISTSPAAEIDTQGSARLAAFAASLLAGVDMMRYDFYYAIEAPSIIVGGPSAGAAMALATLDLLTNATCNPRVDVTGMIQPDASIGPVGGLKEKLEAAARGGARLFIVPAGQEVYTYYKTVYKTLGPFVWVVREPVTVNLTAYGEKLGVRVATAATLLEEYELATNRTLETRPATTELPGWFTDALGVYVRLTARRVNETLEGAARRYGFIAALAANATSEAREALRLLGEGRPYDAAITAVQAYTDALEARYLTWGLTHRLDVTGVVEDVNSTIIRAWDEAANASSSAGGALGYLLAARAYGMLGVAAYYYKAALRLLDHSGGRYYIPYTLLSGLDTRGVETLAQAGATAYWASFWANLTRIAPPGPPVSRERLARLASLLEAQARTTVAYLETLLGEAGAPVSRAGLAEALAGEALASRDPAAVIGLSIESIAASTRVIHETFTLEPSRTARQLTLIAGALQPPGDLGAVSRALLGLAESAGSPEVRLIAASKAVLYSWLERILSESQGKPPAPITTASNAGNTGSHTATSQAGGAQHQATGTTTRSPASPTASPGPLGGRGAEALAAAALGAALAAIVVCALTRRSPQPQISPQ